MKVVLLSQHFHPEPNFITKDLALALTETGAKVYAVVAHPNYPLGRFYDSVTSIWPSCEKLDRLTVWRLPIIPSHDLSKVRRFLHYMSFAVVAQFVLPFICLKPKIVVVYQTPFTTALAALFYKYFFRTKLIYIIPDLWPESFAASGIRVRPFLSKALYFYSRWINRRADKIICTTRGMMRRYHNDGIDEKKLLCLPLWVDGSGGQLRQSEKQSTFNCVYAGNLGAAQGIDTIVKSAKIIAAVDPEIKFDIYGAGLLEEKLKQELSSLALKNITFHGRVTPEDAFKYSSSASIQLIHLVSSPLFAMTVPSKLAFSLSAGTPIVAGLIGESADILAECGGALVVPPENPDEMAKAILAIKSMSEAERVNLGRRCREFYDQNLDKRKLVPKYVDFILNH